MKVLNLVNKEKSEITYNIEHFPDGEPRITLGIIDTKEFVKIICRITNTEELFILIQCMDILYRHGAMFLLDIYYLMGMRNDRVMAFNRPFTLKIVSSIINSYKPFSVSVLEPHSEKVNILLNNYKENININHLFHISDNAVIIYPDEGAFYRYKHNNMWVSCIKNRDTLTGKIKNISLDIKYLKQLCEDSNTPIIVRDDLCDGGRTFEMLSKIIREVLPNNKLSIIVTHMVNQKGIHTLSSNFDEVYITNSYKDWENLPENITMYDLF